MRLAFATKNLRQLCESQADAERQLGIAVAQSLRHRLADLVAATNATDLVAADLRLVPATPRQQLLVRVGDRHDLVLCANHNDTPLLLDGQVDWSKVTRVQIVDLKELAHA